MSKNLCLFIFLLLSICVVLYPTKSYAHAAGTAPYVKINNAFIVSNPLSLLRSDLGNFLIPQDLAPENYLINQTLSFEIDDNQLMTFLPPDLLANTKFTWDFGDGIKTDEKNTTHTYTKIGSYVVLLRVQVYEHGNPTPIEYTDSYLVHILPTLDTKLPQAIMKINDTLVKNPLSTELSVNFNKKATFDASGSQKAASEIEEYLWDFGDGGTSNEIVVKHTYNNQYVQTPILRIKDKNGFLSYTFAQLANTQTLHKTTKSGKIDWSIGIGIIFITGLAMFFVIKRRQKKN